VTRLPRRERWLVGLWLVVGVTLWHGVYDMTMVEGTKEYLFRSALHAAGRGPRPAIAAVLDGTIYKAVWISTLWASVVLLAGLVTIRVMRPGKS
jgi:hypothetical protein